MMQRQAGATTAYLFGEFRLDLAREELASPAGACVPRRKAFDVLRLLLEAAPAVVTLDDLLDRVWGHHAISASAVPNVIAELRHLLRDDAQRPRYIETRHRRGYRMRAAVRIERHAAGTDLLATLDEACAGAPGAPPRQRLHDLRRIASERGLQFLALQAQLALQAGGEPEAASFDDGPRRAQVTEPACRR